MFVDIVGLVTDIGRGLGIALLLGALGLLGYWLLWLIETLLGGRR